MNSDIIKSNFESKNMVLVAVEQYFKEHHMHLLLKLERHICHCGFDGYSFLESADQTILVANCLRFGGFKVKTEDLKK